MSLFNKKHELYGGQSLTVTQVIVVGRYSNGKPFTQLMDLDLAATVSTPGDSIKFDLNLTFNGYD